MKALAVLQRLERTERKAGKAEKLSKAVRALGDDSTLPPKELKRQRRSLGISEEH